MALIISCEVIYLYFFFKLLHYKEEKTVIRFIHIQKKNSKEYNQAHLINMRIKVESERQK